MKKSLKNSRRKRKSRKRSHRKKRKFGSPRRNTLIIKKGSPKELDINFEKDDPEYIKHITEKYLPPEIKKEPQKLPEIIPEKKSLTPQQKQNIKNALKDL